MMAKVRLMCSATGLGKGSPGSSALASLTAKVMMLIEYLLAGSDEAIVLFAFIFFCFHMGFHGREETSPLQMEPPHSGPLREEPLCTHHC